MKPGRGALWEENSGRRTESNFPEAMSPIVLGMPYTTSNKRFWRELSLRMNMWESIDEVV